MVPAAVLTVVNIAKTQLIVSDIGNLYNVIQQERTRRFTAENVYWPVICITTGVYVTYVMRNATGRNMTTASRIHDVPHRHTVVALPAPILQNIT